MGALALKVDWAENIAQSLSVYRDDPVGFAEDVLKVKLWARQQQMARALVRHGRVTVRSGHGVGKSWTIAVLLLWIICTRPKVEGIVTAPTFRQLTNVVFRRVEDILKNSLLKDIVECTRTQVRFGDNLIQAATARKGEGLQGVHADPEVGSVIIVIDEASGVEDQFFDSLEGALATGQAFVLMTGNPTQTQGKFFNSHTSERADWYPMRVSSEESPFVNREWIEGRKKAWGEDSDLYRVRVLGEFPRVDGQTLVPLAWVDESLLVSQRSHQKMTGLTHGYVIGVDVARMGKDSSAVVVRRGHFILGEYIATFRGLRTTELAGYVQHLYNELLLKSPKSPNTGQIIRPIICVDAVGIGAGVFDTLKGENLNVREVQVAETTPDTTFPRCHRLRDWLYWQVREFFNPENELEPLILVPDEEGKRELVEQMIAECTALTFRFLPGDAIKVEDKDSYRKRNSGRSPDLCDALALTFARESKVPARRVATLARWRQRRDRKPGWVV